MKIYLEWGRLGFFSGMVLDGMLSGMGSSGFLSGMCPSRTKEHARE